MRKIKRFGKVKETWNRLIGWIKEFNAVVSFLKVLRKLATLLITLLPLVCGTPDLFPTEGDNSVGPKDAISMTTRNYRH